MESISRAIRQAAAERQWYVESEDSESIIVSTTVRDMHRATVVIGFDAVKFRIDYRDSSNLGYTLNDLTTWRASQRIVVKKGPRIHGNYNYWVQALADHIATRTSSLIADHPPSTSPALIADELDKLDHLRARGVLTQEEFDAMKAKLLAR